MRWLVSFLLVSTQSFGSTPAANVSNGQESKVKYKAGKDLNFEELLIEGQLKRPELGVVTGDEDQNQNGLLKLRENFVDRIAADSGEEAP
ncbi:MAG: hypothetical protein IT289_04265 [Oligoflexia bacterium]|nr:hypothetical protein [Oligoflexia bacterium]